MASAIPPDPKSDLCRYLQIARDAVIWKLEGLTEYDVRRPLTSTGTNLLGLVKHLAAVEAGYLGLVFGRPFPETLPTDGLDDPGADPHADLWVRPEETRAHVLGLYRRACSHADATVAALPLDAVGHVPHWPDDRPGITLHRALVHLTAETHRHAGHADILRESIDGAVGHRAESDNMAEGPDGDWSAHRARVEAAAREATAREATDRAPRA